MSTKNKLPTKDNCEIYCKSDDKLFTFGVQKQIEDCPTGKLYICFQFGHLDEDKIANQKIEDVTCEFHLLLKWTEKLTKE